MKCKYTYVNLGQLRTTSLICFLLSFAMITYGQSSKTERLKQEVKQTIDGKLKVAQVMVDKVFSFAELGFQEVETSKYLTDALKKEGFEIEYGISGIPTAWMARWGNGKPVIALGSDLDCIPKASQRPGVAYHDPIIDGAPGHGEGCLLYTSPSPRDKRQSRMPSSA